MGHTIREYADQAGINLDTARKRVAKMRSESPEHFEKVHGAWTCDDDAYEQLLKLDNDVTVVQTSTDEFQALKEENSRLKDMVIQYQGNVLEERNTRWEALEEQVKQLSSEVQHLRSEVKDLKERQPRFGWRK